MTFPTISIVTPSYQQAPFIDWTIRSVLQQDYPALEYVVMDGGSTDGSAERIARYAPYLAHWQSEKDDGQADAIRRGFMKTSGDIMAYLNSDDLLAPDTLHQVARYFAENPEVDAVYSNRLFIDGKNTVLRCWSLPAHHDWFIRRKDYIPQETCFWRRGLYERVGGIDSSYRFAMDYDLFVRFMQTGRMRHVDGYWGAFRQHGDSKTETQLRTTGNAEIARLRKRHGITSSPAAELACKAMQAYIKTRSALRGRSARLPIRIGQDYDTLWQGRLNAPNLPEAFHA